MAYNNLYLFKPKENMNPAFPTHYSTYTPLFKDALLNKIAKDTGLVIDPLNRKVTALEIEFFCHALVDHVGKEVLKTIKEETNKL